VKDSYSEKFRSFLELIERCKRKEIDAVLVAYPWVLGDTYEELTESLNQIADAGVQLGIAKRNPPHRHHD